MSREIIIEIIENFRQQKQRYSHMLALADEQLTILEKSQGKVYSSEIDELLKQRRELLEGINEKNQKNRQLQDQILKELGIEEFNLGQLEKKLEAVHYQALKELISDLSKPLKMICEKDLRSQELMQQAIKARRQKKPATSDQKASQAYRQFMDKDTDNS